MNKEGGHKNCYDKIMWPSGEVRSVLKIKQRLKASFRKGVTGT